MLAGDEVQEVVHACLVDPPVDPVGEQLIGAAVDVLDPDPLGCLQGALAVLIVYSVGSEEDSGGTTSP